MYTVIGIERKVGKYEGREYDNTILHCSYEKKDVDGVCVVSIKVKTERIDYPLELGCTVSPLYDRFGNVVQLDVTNG